MKTKLYRWPNLVKRVGSLTEPLAQTWRLNSGSAPGATEQQGHMELSALSPTMKGVVQGTPVLLQVLLIYEFMKWTQTSTIFLVM